MMGRTIVKRGMRRMMFLLSGLKRGMKPPERINVMINVANRASSMWASNVLPIRVTYSNSSGSEDKGHNNSTPPLVM